MLSVFSVKSFQSALIGISMCKKDISWVEYSKVNLIVGWGLLMKSLGIGSDYSVPMKVWKISYIIFFQRNIVQITVCLVIFS